MTQRRLTERERDLLKPWSEIYARLYERLDNMPDEQLSELLWAASAVSQTNCWCMTYNVAEVLRKEAGRILAQRSYAASRSDGEEAHSDGERA